MNKFEAIACIDEVAIKKGSYETFKWMDGEKTNEKITVNTYRGKVTADINGYSMTFKVDAQDKSIFCRNGNPPRANKNFSQIEKLLNMERGTKVKFTGEVIDGMYYSAKNDTVVETNDWRIDTVQTAEADAEEECFLNTIARFSRSYNECLTEDGAPIPGKEDVYKTMVWISPSWGKRYIPLTSSYKDKFVYVPKDYMDAMLEYISDDGETPIRSMKITFGVHFVHKGGASKTVAAAGSFGKSRAVSTGAGWDETELWVEGGDYYEPVYNYDDDGNEVLQNDNLIITSENLKAAQAAYKEKKNSRKEEYLAWKNKPIAVDDGDDAF